MEKNILITGASSGIGEQTAGYLSEMGYCVVLVARNKQKLEQLQKELPNESYIVSFDLTNLEKIEEIFHFAKSRVSNWTEWFTPQVLEVMSRSEQMIRMQ